MRSERRFNAVPASPNALSISTSVATLATSKDATVAGKVGGGVSKGFGMEGEIKALPASVFVGEGTRV